MKNLTTDNSLVHVVILPVFIWNIIPLTGNVLRGILHIPIVEARDEVGATDDVLGIEEPKCAFLVLGDKLGPVQPLCLPPSPIISVNLEPTDPEDIHICEFRHGGVQNPDPVDREDTYVYVWVGGVARRECHHVWTASHVYLVHPSPEVIRSVEDAHRAPLLKFVTGNKDLVAVAICECGRFGIVLAVEDASKQVVCQLWDKVLLIASVW